MPIPLAVGIAVTVGSQILSGILGSRSSRSNSRKQYRAALENARLTREAGIYNASMIGAVGAINAFQQMAVGKINATAIKNAAIYNMSIQRGVTAYNTSLLDYEKDILFDAFNLNALQLDNFRGQAIGIQRADQAASGTVIDIDSNAQAVVSNETQFELDATVLRHNYDLAATKINNEINKGQWEGEVAIQGMRYDAELGIWSSLTQSAIGAAATSASAGLESRSTLYNAEINAQSIINQGRAGQATAANTARAQMFNSVLRGIASGASMWMNTQYRPGTSLID